MSRKLRFGLVFAAFALGCAGPSYRMNLKPYELSSTDFTYPSGLRVLFQEDKSQPSVMIASVIDAGSAAEPPGKEGMAHLIEHLCFRALHGDNPKVWDHMKQLGAGFFNASTSQDWTDYYTLVPKDSMIPMLEIEMQRMLDPLEGVTEKDLEVEREVVRNELRLGYENDIRGFFKHVNEALYPKGHPYSRSTIGSHDSLDNITMEDIQAFVDEHYVPSKFTIVVTGDFDGGQAGAIMAKMAGKFGPEIMLPPGATDQKVTLVTPKPRVSGPSEEPPPPVDTSIRRMKAPIPNETVVLAWSLPGGYRSNQALMEVTAATMGRAISSLLYPDDPTRISTDKVESVGCFADPNRHTTTVYCFVDLVEGQDAEEITKKALDGVWQLWSADAEMGMEFGIGDDRVKLPGNRKLFAIAKADYQASIFRNSASLYRANPLAHYLHFRGRPDMFSNQIKEVNGITSFDARDLAHKYLNRERAVRLILEPYEIGEEPVATVAIDGSASWAGATAEGGASGKERFKDITPEEIAALAVTLDPKQFRTFTLENGLEVMLKRHGSAPFVSVSLYSGGGYGTAEPWGLPHFAFTNYTTQDPGKIAGGWSSFGMDAGNIIGVDAPAGNLAAALDLVYDRTRTTQSTWTRRRFDRAKERTERRVKTDEKRPEIWASRALWNLLLPEHPFGQREYDFEALSAVSAGQYDEWFKTTLSPKNSTLFVIGDVDFEEAEKQIRAMWGGWRKSDPGAPAKGYPPPPSAPKRQIALVDNPEGTQSSLRVACHIKPKTPENEAARDVLTGILQEDLWAAIRERAGASYGVGVSSMSDKAGTSLLFVSSSVQNDKTIGALNTVLDRMGEIRGGKLDPVVLKAAKWKIASATRSKNQSAFEILFTMIDLAENDRTVDSMLTYPQRLSKVTSQDLSDLLEPCAGREVVTVVGPQKLLEAPLEKMKIPVQIVDWRKGADADPSVESTSAEATKTK